MYYVAWKMYDVSWRDALWDIWLEDPGKPGREKALFTRYRGCSPLQRSGGVGRGGDPGGVR